MFMLKKALIIFGMLFVWQITLLGAESFFQAQDTQDYTFNFNQALILPTAQALAYFALNPTSKLLKIYFEDINEEHIKHVRHYIQLINSSNVTVGELADNLLADLNSYSTENSVYQTSLLIFEAFLISCSKLGKLDGNLIKAITTAAQKNNYHYIREYLKQHTATQNILAVQQTQTSAVIQRAPSRTLQNLPIDAFDSLTTSGYYL